MNGMIIHSLLTMFPRKTCKNLRKRITFPVYLKQTELIVIERTSSSSKLKFEKLSMGTDTRKRRRRWKNRVHVKLCDDETCAAFHRWNRTEEKWIVKMNVKIKFKKTGKTRRFKTVFKFHSISQSSLWMQLKVPMHFSKFEMIHLTQRIEMTRNKTKQHKNWEKRIRIFFFDA